MKTSLFNTSNHFISIPSTTFILIISILILTEPYICSLSVVRRPEVGEVYDVVQEIENDYLKLDKIVKEQPKENPPTTAETANSSSPTNTTTKKDTFAAVFKDPKAFFSNLFKTSGNATVAILIFIALGIALILGIIIYCCCCRKSVGGSKGRRQGNREDDMLNFNDDDEGDPDCGVLEYTLEYDMKKFVLKVGVIQARDLVQQFGQAMDPYVKVMLEPADKSARKKPLTTKVKKDTCDPVFNESFFFPMSYEVLLTKTVIFQIFDWDTFGQDELVGTLSVEIEKLDSQAFLGKTLEKTSNLKRGANVRNGQGDICIILRHIPAKNILQVTVLEVKNVNLDASKFKKFPPLFCKLFLKVNQRTVVKKTSTRENTPTPYYGDTFEFNMTRPQLLSSELRVKLYYKWLSITRLIGQVRIGKNVKAASGRAHWEDITDNPLRPSAMWHTLWRGEAP